jgi:lipopolysaccharide biosynthesis glycosyltransferase
MGEENIIHIGTAFDEQYITPFYVLLTSIFYNNPGKDIVVHSIATGVSSKEKEKLKNFAGKHKAKILFYDIDEEYIKKNVVIPVNNYFTIATYYRLFLPYLVPSEVKRILFIDTDAVVINELESLYHMDIGNAPFAAASDPYPEIREDLGIYKEGEYFNAGVLLIDVAQWKDQKVTEKAMQFIKDHPEKIKWVDQDALNATQKERWYRLDRKYNMTKVDVMLHIPKKELVKDKVIIHYTTAQKPWKALGNNKLRYLYHYYLKRSPCASQKKYIDFKWSGTVLRRFVEIRLYEWFFEYPLLVGLYRKIRGRSLN